MNILKEFSLNDKCSYLKNLEQTTHYKVINNCSALECQELIERGYRRFGKMYFRPICPDCNECQSIKIDVDNYKFSKSARRVMRKAEHITSYIQQPTITKEHLQLFEKYHLYMKDKKGWEHNKTTADHYYSSFVLGHENFGYEILYYDNERLIAVDLIDILEDGISSIYFYYDPDYAYLSLGKLSLYNQIQYAKETQKKWIYLGYYVAECPSLSYKKEYKPYLTLQGRPKETEEYIWTI
ncbi:MAG: arginyltransferase [Campylobacterales bacterium]|nr:arginyltransferase [Campylobacterales bacterium]